MLEDAINEYSQVKSMDPVLMAVAIRNRGNAKLMLGRAADAFADYKSAIAFHTGDVDAWCALPLALEADGRAEEAQKALMDCEKTQAGDVE